MMNNYMAVVEYDGTNYNGFQIQPGGTKTIQGELAVVLSKVLDEKVDFKYAGRTDTGVHATYQVINFKTGKDLDIYRILWSVNSLLPDDIVIKKIEKVGPSFDARRDARLREYSYFIVNKKYQSVFLKKYSILITRELDIRLMRKAARMFLGVKDFASFCNPDCLGSNTVREIKRFTVEKTKDDLVIFKIAANSFLYNMVRIIAGTVLEIGSGGGGTREYKRSSDEKRQKVDRENSSGKGPFSYKS